MILDSSTSHLEIVTEKVLVKNVHRICFREWNHPRFIVQLQKDEEV